MTLANTLRPRWFLRLKICRNPRNLRAQSTLHHVCKRLLPRPSEFHISWTKRAFSSLSKCRSAETDQRDVGNLRFPNSITGLSGVRWIAKTPPDPGGVTCAEHSLPGSGGVSFAPLAHLCPGCVAFAERPLSGSGGVSFAPNAPLCSGCVAFTFRALPSACAVSQDSSPNSRPNLALWRGGRLRERAPSAYAQHGCR